MLLLNAFSLNMVEGFPAVVSAKEISVDEARTALTGGFTSAVGHADTAAVFSNVLEMDVANNRLTVSLAKGQTVIVGQYIGPRLPEGASLLPEGATIKWLLVSVS